MMQTTESAYTLTDQEVVHSDDIGIHSEVNYCWSFNFLDSLSQARRLEGCQGVPVHPPPSFWPNNNNTTLQKPFEIWTYL